MPTSASTFWRHWFTTMLSESRSFMQAANWLVTIPGLVILSLVVAFNLMGDGLRDALDPKLKQ